MIASPKIIIIKNEEPWLVYLPIPAMAKLKIYGHNTEQAIPPQIKANMDTCPVVSNTITIATKPNTEKYNNAFDCFS